MTRVGVLAGGMVRAKHLVAELGLDDAVPLSVAPQAGRRGFVLDALLIDESARPVPERVYDEIIPGVVPTGGRVYELRRLDGLMTFGDAIDRLKAGERVTRVGWNGAGQFLELQRPDAHSKMTVPYIFITTVQGDQVPWLASQTDMLAGDWRLA